MKESIKNTIIKLQKNDEFIKDIFNITENTKTLIKSNIYNDIKKIKSDAKYINETINNISTILDNSVYGHKNAKRQIERIIGQWVTGEQKGYCFGFEGPPGVGKTSLVERDCRIV